nr:hypothetical protein [Oceanobacillus bengalensis]
MEEQGITEEFLSLKLVGFEEVDGGYNVTTREDYNIYYGDETGKYKAFESEFFVTLLDDGLTVHTLLDTTELDSEDL